MGESDGARSLLDATWRSWLSTGTLEHMYPAWLDGASKSALEREYLNRPGSHGMFCSALMRRELGVETEKPSKLVEEDRRRRRLPVDHGIDPAPEPGL